MRKYTLRLGFGKTDSNSTCSVFPKVLVQIHVYNTLCNDSTLKIYNNDGMCDNLAYVQRYIEQNFQTKKKRGK